MVRLTRSGDPAQSGSGSAPSVASRACGRSLEQACLPACLSCAPPRYYPQQQEVSVLDVQLFRPGRLTQTRLSYGSPGPWAGGQIHRGVGATHLLPWRDLADGWEWRQPFPSDRFASASLSWFVLPWPRVNAESPPSTTPEDPSVRLVWNLPQSVRPQTLLQDNPSLESGRPSLGLSAHSSMPEPPPAAALASPTRRVNLSLPPPV